jgi:hypothetical protein
LDLIELLWWSKLKMVGRNPSVDSFNKALARGGGFSWRSNCALLLPHWCGADIEEKVPDDAIVDFIWPWGRSMMRFGDLHTRGPRPTTMIFSRADDLYRR